MFRLLFWMCCLLVVSTTLAFQWGKQAPDYEECFGLEWEAYEPELFYRLQNVEDMLSFADSALGADLRRSEQYGELLTDLVRRRFYHGYSYYTPKDNWLAWLAGTLVWDHLHAIVIPDDIMKHPMAACSQQAIVLTDCFKRTGIDYREVGLRGHFVLEGKIKGNWLLFDSNKEPRFANGRKSIDSLQKSGELIAAYEGKLSPQVLNVMFAHPEYKQVNAPIAPNATLFHQITKILSLTLPLLFFLGLSYLIIKKQGWYANRNKDWF